MNPKVKEMDNKQQPTQESANKVNLFAMWFFIGSMIVAVLAIAYTMFFGK
jgi:cation transport ATPase